jgi:hypothetical protein
MQTQGKSTDFELSGLWRVFGILPFDICFLILSLHPSEALNLGR